MWEYRLFIIRRENVSLFQKNQKLLYDTLKVLFLQKENLNIGYSLYRQLCIPFSVSLLCNYISDKLPCRKIEDKKYQLLSFFENTEVDIHYSHVKIKTDKQYSEILKTFYIYQKNIFVVDFKRETFFWLTEEIRKHI